MEFVNYFSASIISFLGLAAGSALIMIAPEEQKPLKKHFERLEKMLLFFIIAFTTFHFYDDIFYIIAFIAFASSMIFTMLKGIKKLTLSYSFFGIVFFLSSRISNLFIAESSLIFLYGIAASSLLYIRREKNSGKIMLHGSVFMLAASLLYFV